MEMWSDADIAGKCFLKMVRENIAHRRAEQKLIDEAVGIAYVGIGITGDKV